MLVAIVLLLHAWQTRHVVSGAAPDFQGTLVGGAPVSLQEFRGRPLLLQFWATWCPICRMEQRSIDNIASRHRVLSVSIDEISADEIKQWMDRQGVSYPVIADPSGDIARLFGVKGVPTSVFIDADGMIRSVSVGYTSETGMRVRLWWAGFASSW